MAKPGIQTVVTTGTFQNWLDKTNQIINVLQTDIVTASSVGDTTGSLAQPVTANVIGTVSANNVIAETILRTDSIAPKVGSSSILLDGQITANSSVQTSAIFKSVQGARTTYASDTNNWIVGFFDTASNSFIIDNGAGSIKFVLTSTGNLTLSGSVSATSVTATSFVGNATSATKLATARNINGVAFDGTANITVTANTTNTLTRGTYLTGNNFNGSAATTWAVDATSANTASKVVARDASGNFSAGTITANLNGNAATVTNGVYTSRTISAGTGLSGGGDLSANITISLSDIAAGSTSTGALYYNGTTRSAGRLYGGTTNPSSTTRLNYDGNLHVYRLTAVDEVTAFSDARLKEEVVTIDNALETVEKMRGVRYKRIDTGKTNIGLIAQELQSVLPEVVIEDDLLSVSYGNIVALLIEAIKELKVEVNNLKNK